MVAVLAGHSDDRIVLCNALQHILTVFAIQLFFIQDSSWITVSAACANNLRPPLSSIALDLVTPRPQSDS